MLVLAAVSLALLALAGVGAVCDRWGPADPRYPLAPGLLPVRCVPDPSRSHSSRSSGNRSSAA